MIGPLISQTISLRSQPCKTQLNDVFSIHFSVALLIAGKFHRTVDAVHSKDACRCNRWMQRMLGAILHLRTTQLDGLLSALQSQ